MMESGCVELDDQMNSDLLKIMDENAEKFKSDFAELISEAFLGTAAQVHRG